MELIEATDVENVSVVHHINQALRAHKLDPSLVPAAAVAARLLSQQASTRKASKIIKETWILSPHPELAEAFIKRLFSDALSKCPEDMKFFVERIDKDAVQRLEAILKTDFLRVTYTEAIEILKNSNPNKKK